MGCGGAVDDMVEDGDAHQGGCAHEFASEADVGFGGCGIAARVVMGEDDGASIGYDGGTEDVPGANHDAVDRAGGEHFVTDDAVADVEQNGAEDFNALGIPWRGGDVVVPEFVDVFGVVQEGVGHGEFAEEARLEFVGDVADGCAGFGPVMLGLQEPGEIWGGGVHGSLVAATAAWGVLAASVAGASEAVVEGALVARSGARLNGRRLVDVGKAIDFPGAVGVGDFAGAGGDVVAADGTGSGESVWHGFRWVGWLWVADRCGS